MRYKLLKGRFVYLALCSAVARSIQTTKTYDTPETEPGTWNDMGYSAEVLPVL